MDSELSDNGVLFARDLAGLLRVELDPSMPVRSDTSLFDDWALDSLQAFEMIVVIEAMAEAAVPPPTLPELFTVGDAYGYYRSLRGQSALD